MAKLKISTEELIKEAGALASINNPDVSMLQRNLDLLVDAINSEADLREVVLPMVSHSLAQSLRNRLEVEQWVRDYPEIRNEVIEQPIFLTGLPRSGTTYFQYLFDPEPSMRMLRYWEGERPCPPPGFAPETISGRIEWCAQERASAQQKDSVRAKLAQIHLSDADGPEECLKLIDQTFLNVGHYWTFRVPSYFNACLDEQALLQAYEYHKLALQLLQWRSNKQRWVLKWPCHLVALEQILQVHPEARFVVTHRDPVQALASNCSLATLLRRGTSNHVDPHEVGNQMLDMLLAYLERLVAFDEKHGDRMAHVAYQTAVEQPEIAMEQALTALGIPMSTSFAEAIQSWRRDNPPGKRGTHDYALEDYGLDADEMKERFAFYINRYDIPSERESL